MSEFVIDRQNDVLVARAKSETFIDDVSIIQVGREMLALADIADGKMLLNFEGVTFMSSAMIGKVVVLSKKCRTDDIDLKMCNVPSSVISVLGKRRLDNVFQIFDSQDEALQAFE